MSTLRKARENASDDGAIGFSFASGWVISASFLDQSQSEVKQNQNNSE